MCASFVQSWSILQWSANTLSITAAQTFPRKQSLSTVICQERTTTIVCTVCVALAGFDWRKQVTPYNLFFPFTTTVPNTRRFVGWQEFRHKFTHERTATHFLGNKRFFNAKASGDLLSAGSLVSHSVTHERYPQILIGGWGSHNLTSRVTEQIYLCAFSLFTFYSNLCRDDSRMDVWALDLICCLSGVLIDRRPHSDRTRPFHVLQ